MLQILVKRLTFLISASFGGNDSVRWHCAFHTNNTKFDCFKKTSFLKRVFKNPFKFKTELIFPENSSYAAIQWDEGADTLTELIYRSED